MPRFHCPVPLHSGASIELPPGAARHVQVLRLQPGATITLFDGAGGEYDAVVERMGRSDVAVQVGAHNAMEREARRPVVLAVAMPANERMDWLVEKATELGVAAIQPLLTERAVLRPQGERAIRKRAHWEAIAVAACEQCGRNRIPRIHEVAALDAWLGEARSVAGPKFVLSFRSGAVPLGEAAGAGAAVVLAGPEGGLTAAEEDAALAAGFRAATLGPRVLRVETAALAAMALLD